MTPNETPDQRRERMLDILINHNVSDIRDPSTISAMIAVEDACRATMFTEEQIRQAIIEAVQLGLSPDASYDEIPFNEIINQIKPPTP